MRPGSLVRLSNRYQPAAWPDWPGSDAGLARGLFCLSASPAGIVVGGQRLTSSLRSAREAGESRGPDFHRENPEFSIARPCPFPGNRSQVEKGSKRRVADVKGAERNRSFSVCSAAFCILPGRWSSSFDPACRFIQKSEPEIRNSEQPALQSAEIYRRQQGRAMARLNGSKYLSALNDLVEAAAADIIRSAY